MPTPSDAPVNVNYLTTVVERLAYDVRSAEGKLFLSYMQSRRRFQLLLALMISTIAATLGALVFTLLGNEPGGLLAAPTPADGTLRVIALLFVGVGLGTLLVTYTVSVFVRRRPAESVEVPPAFVQRLTEDVIDAAKRAIESQRQPQ